jgi:DNA-directed RNA polymerase specialized sigma24 family protein
MARRQHRHWAPPLSGPPSNRGPSMSESVSDDEKAGKPIGPYVELRPKSPPLQITELSPTEEPPPPPFNREAALTVLQAAFAQLGDDELQVVRLRMLAVPYADISDELGMLDEEVEKLWKQARRKLGTTLFGTGNTPTQDPTSQANVEAPVQPAVNNKEPLA